MYKENRRMSTTREQLMTRLEALGISTQTSDHAPAFTVEEAKALRGEIPGGHCKNLFLKDKKGQLWLVVTLEEAQIDLKVLPAKIGAARISFGKPDLLMDVLGIAPGSVTPFALINDTEQRVNVVLEKRMMDHKFLNYHPLSNEATTTIASEDLQRFVTSCGHTPQIVDLD